MSETITWPVTVKLSRPIEITGNNGPEKLDSITLTEPTAEQWFRIGPVQRVIAQVPPGASPTGTDPVATEVRPDPQAVRRYLVEMSGRSSSEIDQLALTDITALYALLNGALKSVGN